MTFNGFGRGLSIRCVFVWSHIYIYLTVPALILIIIVIYYRSVSSVVFQFENPPTAPVFATKDTSRTITSQLIHRLHFLMKPNNLFLTSSAKIIGQRGHTPFRHFTSKSIMLLYLCCDTFKQLSSWSKGQRLTR